MSRVVQFLRLRGLSIFRQLQIEEALLRTDDRNWCLVNENIKEKAVVLGVSAKLHEVLNVERARHENVLVVRRFSGGGTVVIDNNAVLVTFIFQKDALPSVQPYPRSIMEWTEKLYSAVFSPFGGFGLKENDYTFGELKFGGNAQSVVKNRWLHHTSFLWNIDYRSMELLKQPPRQPVYRENRSHRDFLCAIGKYFESKDVFFDSLQNTLKLQGFEIQESEENLEAFCSRPHIRRTFMISLNSGQNVTEHELEKEVFIKDNQEG